MKNNKILIGIFLISLMITLSSCVVTSDNPLGNIDSSIDDPGLMGIWRIIPEEQDDESYLSILEGKNGYLQLITFTGGIDEVAVFRGFVTQVGKDRYLNLQYVGDVGSNMKFGDEYIFMHYFINGAGRLTLAAWSEYFFKKAVKERRLKGNIKKTKTSLGFADSNVRIQASTDELIKFLNNNSKKEYLDEPTMFRRMRVEN